MSAEKGKFCNLCKNTGKLYELKEKILDTELCNVIENILAKPINQVHLNILICTDCALALLQAEKIVKRLRETICHNDVAEWEKRSKISPARSSQRKTRSTSKGKKDDASKDKNEDISNAIEEEEHVKNEMKEAEEVDTPSRSLDFETLLKDWKFNCKLCDYTTNRAKWYKRHLITKHELKDPPIYHCLYCSVTKQRVNAIRVHIECDHGNKPRPTRRRKSLDTRQQPGYRVWVDNKPDNYIDGRYEFKCYYCEYKTLDMQVFKTHLKIKHEVQEKKIFKCYKCSCAYVSERVLRNHMAVKHKIRNQSSLESLVGENVRKSIRNNTEEGDDSAEELDEDFKEVETETEKEESQRLERKSMLDRENVPKCITIKEEEGGDCVEEEEKDDLAEYEMESEGEDTEWLKRKSMLAGENVGKSIKTKAKEDGDCAEDKEKDDVAEYEMKSEGEEAEWLKRKSMLAGENFGKSITTIEKEGGDCAEEEEKDDDKEVEMHSEGEEEERLKHKSMLAGENVGKSITTIEKEGGDCAEEEEKDDVKEVEMQSEGDEEEWLKRKSMLAGDNVGNSITIKAKEDGDCAEEEGQNVNEVEMQSEGEEEEWLKRKSMLAGENEINTNTTKERNDDKVEEKVVDVKAVVMECEEEESEKINCTFCSYEAENTKELKIHTSLAHQVSDLIGDKEDSDVNVIMETPNEFTAEDYIIATPQKLIQLSGETSNSSLHLCETEINEHEEMKEQPNNSRESEIVIEPRTATTVDLLKTSAACFLPPQQQQQTEEALQVSIGKVMSLTDFLPESKSKVKERCNKDEDITKRCNEKESADEMMDLMLEVKSVDGSGGKEYVSNRYNREERSKQVMEAKSEDEEGNGDNEHVTNRHNGEECSKPVIDAISEDEEGCKDEPVLQRTKEDGLSQQINLRVISNTETQNHVQKRADKVLHTPLKKNRKKRNSSYNKQMRNVDETEGEELEDDAEQSLTETQNDIQKRAEEEEVLPTPLKKNRKKRNSSYNKQMRNGDETEGEELEEDVEQSLTETQNDIQKRAEEEEVLPTPLKKNHKKRNSSYNKQMRNGDETEGEELEEDAEQNLNPTANLKKASTFVVEQQEQEHHFQTPTKKPTPKQLVKHDGDMSTSEWVFLCTHCNYECTKRKAYKEHVKRTHNICEENIYQCLYCTAAYERYKSLKQHVTQMHCIDMSTTLCCDTPNTYSDSSLDQQQHDGVKKSKSKKRKHNAIVERMTESEGGGGGDDDCVMRTPEQPTKVKRRKVLSCVEEVDDIKKMVMESEEEESKKINCALCSYEAENAKELKFHISLAHQWNNLTDDKEDNDVNVIKKTANKFTVEDNIIASPQKMIKLAGQTSDLSLHLCETEINEHEEMKEQPNTSRKSEIAIEPRTATTVDIRKTSVVSFLPPQQQHQPKDALQVSIRKKMSLTDLLTETNTEVKERRNKYEEITKRCNEKESADEMMDLMLKLKSEDEEYDSGGKEYVSNIYNGEERSKQVINAKSEYKKRCKGTQVLQRTKETKSSQQINLKTTLNTETQKGIEKCGEKEEVLLTPLKKIHKKENSSYNKQMRKGDETEREELVEDAEQNLTETQNDIKKRADKEKILPTPLKKNSKKGNSSYNKQMRKGDDTEREELVEDAEQNLTETQNDVQKRAEKEKVLSTPLKKTSKKENSSYNKQMRKGDETEREELEEDAEQNLNPTANLKKASTFVVEQQEQEHHFQMPIKKRTPKQLVKHDDDMSTSEWIFYCTHCNYESTKRKAYKEHIQHTHNSCDANIYKCLYCTAAYERYKSLKQHVTQMHCNDMSTTICCDTPNTYSDSSLDQQQHDGIKKAKSKKGKHNATAELMIESGGGGGGGDDDDDCVMRRPTEEPKKFKRRKVLSCVVCGKLFSTNEKLMNHMNRLHSNDEMLHF